MNELSYFNISGGQKTAIDPDNAFWGIMDNSSIPQNLLSLYAKVKDRLNTEFNEFRFGKELSAIYIDPTDRCNANCPYCYIPAKLRNNGRSMNRGELAFILKKLARYFNRFRRKPVIIFHASEPLLVKDIIFEVIRKFKKEFYFGLQTNAILLEEEDARFLKKYRVGVGISLDSHLAPVNNRLRKTKEADGNFEHAVKAIKWFAGYDGLNVITTITKFNVAHLSDIVEFLHGKYVPCVLLNPVRLTQKASYALKPDESLMIEYFLMAVDRAIQLSRDSGRRIIIGNFTNIILGIVAPAARRLMCDISPCGGGRCFLTITASGKMIPCGEFIGLRRFSGGNIFKTGVNEAMESKPFKKIRARIVEKIEKCNSCIFRNICGAPCPAELHSLGNMLQPSIFCKFYKKIIEYAFKLIAENKVKYCFREDGLNNLEYDYRLGG
jgi:uncharacterized protein